MPDFKPVDQKEQVNPLLPLVGFIVLVGGGALSWYLAPRLRYYLAAHPLRMGSFGSVRLDFPPSWSPQLANGVTALVLFGIMFAAFMIVMGIIRGSTLPPDQKMARDLAMKEKRQRSKKRRRR